MNQKLHVGASENRLLHLRKVDEGSISYEHRHSISEAARCHKKEILNYSKTYKIFAHWFAIDVYNKFCEHPDEASVQFVQTLSKLMNFDCHEPKILNGYEISYSAIFFQALDRWFLQLSAEDKKRSPSYHW